MLRSAPGGVFANAEGKRALNLKSCRAQPRRRELGPPLPVKLIRRRAKSSYKSESSTSASSHDKHAFGKSSPSFLYSLHDELLCRPYHKLYVDRPPKPNGNADFFQTLLCTLEHAQSPANISKNVDPLTASEPVGNACSPQPGIRLRSSTMAGPTRMSA
jgi:hypothetical protein